MVKSRTIISLFVFIVLAQTLFAQTAPPAERENDPLVLKKLEQFQNMKFGLLMHWGPYSQWGVVESWSLCPEDEDWCKRNGHGAESYDAYRQEYEHLQATFNPVKFDPARWASAAKFAGMRYVVFTTKHHDGFCMFDTKQTDYKVTGVKCPFSANPRSNVAKETFSAFRNEGFGVGAYFSKPDWHSPDYWWPYFPPFDRNVNYDIKKYPDRWDSFKKFTYNQIEELMTGYGPIDILWLDGGWVQPMTATSPRWGKAPADQDIDMPKIAAMARSHQPGLIIVDRAVEGRYQNYKTPEQQVPDTPPDYIWETCMTMGDSWSFVPDDKYKSAEKLIHLLVDIVAKGGNFLLNIGPTPEGELPPVSEERLREIGDWMVVNSHAIYSTRPISPYKESNICYTQMPDGSINAIYLGGEDEKELPETITLSSFHPREGSPVMLLGVNEPLSWNSAGKGCVISVPASVRNNPPCKYAWTFHFTR